MAESWAMGMRVGDWEGLALWRGTDKATLLEFLAHDDDGNAGGSADGDGHVCGDDLRKGAHRRTGAWHACTHTHTYARHATPRHATQRHTNAAPARAISPRQS